MTNKNKFSKIFNSILKITSLSALIAGAVCLSQTAHSAEGKLFTLTEDGGEHPVDKCSVVKKAPAKLIQNKSAAKQLGYVGSVQTEFADKNAAAIDAFDHYYKTEKACEAARTEFNKQSEE